MYNQVYMATSRDRYYTEIFKTLTDYNDCNNTPLLNTDIRETIRKSIEQKSIANNNNVTTDSFNHKPNTQRDNANITFTSENIDKSDELVDEINNLTINNARYYESNTATASDAQGDLTRNMQTVNHTIIGNETVTHTSNGNFEKIELSDHPCCRSADEPKGLPEDCAGCSGTTDALESYKKGSCCGHSIGQRMG